MLYIIKNRISAKHTVVAAVLFACVAFLAPACAPGGETRVARWPLSVFPGAEKKTALATLSQGERVELIAPGEVFSQIRMVDGQEGFVETKHLFVSAAVLYDPEALLYRRPSASSGEAASGKYLKQGAVFFINEFEQNDEGAWMSVEGGRQGNFFRGWLKQDAAHSVDVDDVQDGLRLAEAIRRSDLETLEELSGLRGAIGSAAAAALVDLGGLDEEGEGAGGAGEGDDPAAEATEAGSDSGNEQKQKPAPVKPSKNESDSVKKPAPPAPPGGDVSMPANSATNPAKPPPPPPSL